VETGKRTDAGRKLPELAAIAFCTAVVVCSGLLGPGGEWHSTGERVSLTRDGTWVLPACPFHTVTGIRCPGCGTTRSFIAMGHGRLAQAWRHNRIGPIIYLLILVQIPYRVLRLAWPAFGRRTASDGLTLNALAAAACLLIANWMLLAFSGGIG